MAPASLYVTDSYYVSALGGTGRANHAWVVIDGPKLPEAVKPALEAQFEQANLSVTSIKTVSDERSFVDFHFNIMVVPLGLAAVMLALVGGLGLMGTMSTNVLERQRRSA